MKYHKDMTEVLWAFIEEVISVAAGNPDIVREVALVCLVENVLSSGIEGLESRAGIL